MNTPALVTGATGFLGRTLCARLRAASRPVVTLSRAEGASAQAAAALLSSSRPATIFHLAAEAGPDAGIDAVLEANVAVGARLAAGCREAGVARFIAAGSFFTRRTGADDYDPVSPYAATKKAFQDVLEYYARAEGLRAAVVVFYDIYGPDDPRPKILNLLAESARSGRELALTAGEQELDVLHVEDAADALLAAERAVDAAGVGRLHEWCASSGTRLTLKALAAELQEATGLEPKAAFGAKPYRPREVMRPWWGTAVPGWRPNVPLRQGLKAAFGARSRA